MSVQSTVRNGYSSVPNKREALGGGFTKMGCPNKRRKSISKVQMVLSMPTLEIIHSFSIREYTYLVEIPLQCLKLKY